MPRRKRSLPRTRAPYPVECRTEAIRLVQASGKPVAEIARQLEISHETLRAWLTQADIDDGLRHDGLTSEEMEEVRQLRGEVKRLREEREIRLTAAAFVAKETGQTPR